jgi:hypothetical protein
MSDYEKRRDEAAKEFKHSDGVTEGCSQCFKAGADWAREEWHEMGPLKERIAELEQKNDRYKAALEYVQYIHVEKIEHVLLGTQVEEWALRHNIEHAREALAEEDITTLFHEGKC